MVLAIPLDNQKLGAHICTSVGLAQLILVDPATKPGRQFIRDWGQDVNKVVLEYIWARKSIEAGRALLLHDDWGGCKALDDGIHTDDDDDNVEVQQPRKKPSKSKLVHYLLSIESVIRLTVLLTKPPAYP